MLTALRTDSIKLELKPCLQNPHVTDEKLFEKLNGAVSNEMERQQKLGSLLGFATSTNPVPLVAQVTPTKETQTGEGGGGGHKASTEANKPNLLAEVQEMKAEVAVIRESIRSQHRHTIHERFMWAT